MFKRLPKASVSEGLRGELGIDKNINESTIDKYLNWENSVYYDLRMLIDDAVYENIGGDSYLSGFIKGFEVIPYPFIGPLLNMPPEVGSGYAEKSLFKLDKNGDFIPVYKESLDILEYFFPRDKNIFIMCGGGGYAGMLRSMLIKLNYNAERIYNVGGYWNYKGSQNVIVKRKENDNIRYDFWKVPYHNIDFDSLNLIDNCVVNSKNSD